MHYTINRPKSGDDDFVPFGDQFETFPLTSGLTFKKGSYGFSYKQDGRIEQWPGLWTQLKTIALGLFGVIVWFAIGGVPVLMSWLKLPIKRRAE